jgi:predicted nucleic acid-binding protein
MGVTMKVTIDLPEDVSAALKGRWDDVPRRSLEAIAVEGYRTGALTETQVRRLLHLETRFQVHALLKEHHVQLDLGERAAIALATAIHADLLLIDEAAGRAEAKRRNA